MTAVPDQAGLDGDSKGIRQRHHHRGNDSAGKSHIIEGISFMNIVYMGREGRQHQIRWLTPTRTDSRILGRSGR